MARFRIIQRPSRVFLGAYVYDIEERFIFWWDTVSPSWLSLESAEQALDNIKKSKAMDCGSKVIKEYD